MDKTLATLKNSPSLTALSDDGFDIDSLYSQYSHHTCQCYVQKKLVLDEGYPFASPSPNLLVVWDLNEFTKSFPHLPFDNTVLIQLFDVPGVHWIWYNRYTRHPLSYGGLMDCRARVKRD